MEGDKWMNLLITGGAGYIGSHTVVRLLESGYDVVIVDNYMNSKPEVIKRIERITEKRIKVYEVDLRDSVALEQVFCENHFDGVIHFAGLKAVGESVDFPLDYYDNNVVGTLVLLKVMEKCQVQNIVFSSSATVYGDKNQSPLVETMPLSTTNPYGTTKWMIEEMIKDVTYANPNWSAVNLRYFNPIGAHPSGMIGEDPNGIPNNLMPYITQVAIGKRDYLSVFGNDYDTIDGTGVRDYIHVMDLAEGHLKAFDYTLKHKGCHVFNLGTGKGHSVLEVIRFFEKATKTQIPYQIEKRRPGDIATCYASVNKAEKDLKWKAKFDMFKMCEDAWRWQSKNPNGFE